MKRTMGGIKKVWWTKRYDRRFTDNQKIAKELFHQLENFEKNNPIKGVEVNIELKFVEHEKNGKHVKK